jgi:hypothetical protein
VEEWKSGRVEEWKSGKVEEWKSGKVEKWKTTKVQSGKGNRGKVRRSVSDIPNVGAARTLTAFHRNRPVPS